MGTQSRSGASAAAFRPAAEAGMRAVAGRFVPRRAPWLSLASLVAPPWADAALVGAVTAAAAILCAAFDVSEMFRRWSAPWERFQLDELPVVLVVLAAGLAWFAARRYREARLELLRRQAAEARLSAALADNRRLSQQYVDLQEAERRALARELHDELGQYLNVIKLDAVGIRDGRWTGGALHERASAVVENCNHIHVVLAGLIRRLRPVGLDELGLAAALGHCVETWRDRLPDTVLQLSVDGDLTGLPESLAVTVYRLVQEALTNIAKHAAARHVSIRLERSGAAGRPGDSINLSVEDDGRGAELGTPTPGLGLIGMRERVAALEGALSLTSAPGCGFGLRASIPAHLSGRGRP